MRLGLTRITGHRVCVQRRGVGVEPCAWLREGADRQTDDERKACRDFEINQCLAADTAHLLHAVHAGNPGCDGAEDDQRDDHRDQADEGEAKRLHRFAGGRGHQPEDDANGNAEEHLSPQASIERFSSGGGGGNRRMGRNSGFHGEADTTPDSGGPARDSVGRLGGPCFMANLGYIGLGAMGSRMANRLLDKGHTVVGYNRTRSKAQWLIDRGMKWGESPKAVAEAADVIFVMVTDSKALEGVSDGPDGFLAGVRQGKFVVDMSTVSPAVSRAVAEKVRAKGGDMVDAPVSGSVATLEAGKLSVMVGGTRATFDRIKPVLDDVGPKVTHVGDNGLALSLKIAHNLQLAVQMLAFSEGIMLAEKSGISREVAVDVFTHSVVASPMVQYPRAVRAEAAGRIVVRREHDAEGHAARARNGPAARRAAADNGRDERIPDGGSRDGIRQGGFRRGLQGAGADVWRCCAAAHVTGSYTYTRPGIESMPWVDM